MPFKRGDHVRAIYSTTEELTRSRQLLSRSRYDTRRGVSIDRTGTPSSESYRPTDPPRLH